MSIAFYPASGVVAFGSEAAATKAPMGAEGERASFRFDLDDMNGEVVLLRWGDPAMIAACDRDKGGEGDKGGVGRGLSRPGSRRSILCAGAEQPATIVFEYNESDTTRDRRPKGVVAASEAAL